MDYFKFLRVKKVKILNGLNIVAINYRNNYNAFKFSSANRLFHDLTIVLKGELHYNINGENFTVKSGEAMYCPAGGNLQREKSEKASTYVSINFNKSAEGDIFNKHHLTNIISSEVSLYLDTIYHVLKKPSEHNNEKLHHLISLLLLRLLEQQESVQPLPHIERAKLYINENFGSDITLDSVAGFVGLHPSYLSSLFKRSENMSVTEYINFLRVARAKELLETSDYRIGEIGELCGIDDPYYFSRVFSKICGISPSDYRKTVSITGGNSVSFTREKEFLSR